MCICKNSSELYKGLSVQSVELKEKDAVWTDERFTFPTNAAGKDSILANCHPLQ